jgi:hypothetical protein
LAVKLPPEISITCTLESILPFPGLRRRPHRARQWRRKPLVMLIFPPVSMPMPAPSADKTMKSPPCTAIESTLLVSSVASPVPIPAPPSAAVA